MSTIVTRAGKGSPLTNTELDSNFSNLNTDKLELSGGSLTGNLSLGTNNKAIFNSQLEIYGDGSHSYISDVGTGNLIIKGTHLNLRDANNTLYMEALQGGAVTLRHAGNISVATTSTGIDVTGSVVADGVQSTDGNIKVTTLGSFVGFNSQRAGVPSSGGYQLGRLNFDAYSTGTTFVSGASIQSYSDGAAWTSSSTPAYLSFQTTPSGSTSLKERIKVASNGDISFYNDSAAQGLFWDSSTSRLGLGVTNPASLLHLSGANGSGRLELQNTWGTTVTNWRIAPIISGVSNNGFEIRDVTQGVSRFVINSSGNASFSGAVTSTGLTVEGNSVFTTADNSAQVTLISTDTDALVGPKLNLWRNSGTGTNGDLIGEITFTGEDTVGSTNIFASISSIAEQTNNGAEDGSLHFNTLLNGTLAKRLSIGSTSTGGDISFYDSSGSSQNFYWDSSTSRLGLGTTVPASLLHIQGNTDTADSFLTIEDADPTTGSQRPHIKFVGNGTQLGKIRVLDNGTGMQFLTGSSDNIRLAIDSSGSSVFSGSVTSTGLTVSKTASGSTTQIASFVNPVGTANTGVRFWMSGTNTTTRGTFIDAVAESTSNNHTLRFGTSASSALPVERMRIDSLGNLLVGTTDTTIYNNLSGDGGIVLAKVTGGGRIDASRAGSCYTANRLGSDGQLFDFRKNGGIVGRISTVGNDLVIGSSVSGHKGVRFGSSYIAPINTIDAFEDNTTDLGLPAVRFKDLYLSNNATAQKLTLTKDPVGTYTIEVDGTNTGQPNLIVKQSTSERLRIDNQGRVGIGTSNPYGLMHCQDSSTINLIGTNSGADGQTDTTVLSLIGQARGYNNNLPKLASIDFKTDPTTWYKGNITFNVANSDGTDPSLTPLEAMRIDSSGSVGIGNINPNLPLTVTSNSGANAIAIRARSADDYGFMQFYNNAGTALRGQIYNQNGALGFTTSTSGTPRMLIDTSGNLLVGTTSVSTATQGIKLRSDIDAIAAVADGQISGYFGRLNSDGDILNFRKDSTTVGSIGTHTSNMFIGSVDSGLYFDSTNNRISPYYVNNNSLPNGGISLGGNSNRFQDLYLSGTANVQYAGATDTGIYFNGSFNAVVPYRPDTGVAVDDYLDLGVYSHRWDDIFATNGTIQTSDRNEKQDIEDLTEAEERVAVAAKGLLKKFRWKSAVEDKGDDARIHFGIIAQDLQDAFEAEGLDAGRYGMFTSNTWTNEDGEEQTRMGVRYSELLAFIISAI